MSDVSITGPAPFSLWDYLREELLATDFDSHQEMKWERVSNFLNIPFAVEKTIGFGIILCFDSFLYTFTILPIRAALALYRLCANWITFKNSLPPSQKADILRALLLITSLAILAPLTDASKIYHTIRLQETVKLYVIFNAVEIADRLCTSIGQDILDCLFSRSTLAPLSRKVPVSHRTFLPLVYFALAVLYTAHTLVLIYQLISLNVAINSYDHSLLTLLVSNQFVEIKGSVFKKFEKDNLFQITCADIVERFQLSLMMTFIAVRNLIELSGTEFDFSAAVPDSFRWIPGHGLAWTILSPVAMVLLSELCVDWLKHAFITKFNHIRPSVYERYMDVLCLDLASGSAMGRHGARKHTYVDQSPLVARRLGFASLPLACLTFLIAAQAFSSTVSGFDSKEWFHFGQRHIKYGILITLAWVCLVLVKIIMGVNLISVATHRRADMERREAEDVVNDFGRDPIGESKDEKNYNRDLKTLLLQKKDDASRTSDMGERTKDGVKKRPGLNELTRFTMVKYIW
ncbi:hypothetical protein M408DRAFT_317895 [Serendipita vermifera MAFF 305830]|uniref:DUF747-domain-containing protein n=1 Tax=Serendipita vermifera MAFF 305830 TaxID=933852 RepID=A0A0C2X031_SERVB|nr:hypothetical protein M408DRAFT_317895 [Serendipita vermifera MAFF 305830]